MSKSRKFTAYSLMLLFVLLLVAPVAAQSPATAVWQTEQQTVTVGDPVKLTLSVNHPAETEVLFPDLAAAWPQATVVEQTVPQTISNGDGTLTTSQTVDVRFFTPGSIETPAVSVTLSDAAGNLSAIGVAPTAVSVASVLIEGDSELRDIKPQADLPLSNSWMFILPLLLLGGVVVYLIVRKFRRTTPFVDNRLPHERALDDLAVVAEMGLPENGRFKEHYTLISDTLRQYVSKRYQIDILERTTVEMERMISRTDIPQDAARELIALLKESDMVKFADIKPRIADAYLALDVAQKFISTTKPVAEEDVEVAKPQKVRRNLRHAPNGTQQQAEVSA